MFRTALRIPILRTPFLAITTTRLATTQLTAHRTYATQDYGSGTGDPKGENPQEQGDNPREDLEHPGPPAPDVGQHRGGKSGQDTSGTKNLGTGGSSGSSNGGTDASSSGRKGKSATDPGSAGGQSQSNDGANKGKPTKLSAGSPPAEHDEDVKRHNEDLQNRQAQSSGNNDGPEGEKVSEDYWQGVFSFRDFVASFSFSYGGMMSWLFSFGKKQEFESCGVFVAFC